MTPAGRGRGGMDGLGGAHFVGSGNVGEDRRELRRPMPCGNVDDLARGINKMDPYRDEYGRYPYSQSMGMGGQLNNMPPRPAPNADGWSSGENQYGPWSNYRPPGVAAASSTQLSGVTDGVHNTQQGVHSQNYYHSGSDSNAHTPGQGKQDVGQVSSWNIGATEFVPKSTLSVSAVEFVPRSMPRNTSHLAYQQQQQALLAEQEVQYNQQGYQEELPSSRNFISSTYAQAKNSKTDFSHQGCGERGGRGHVTVSSSSYGPLEVLSDAVATLIFMPSKFERTSEHLARKIECEITDLHMLTSFVDLLVEKCLNEMQFRSMAGRFCDRLAENALCEIGGKTFKQVLLEKHQMLLGEQEQLVFQDPVRCRNFLVFTTDLYLQHGEREQIDSDKRLEDKKRSSLLADSLLQLFVMFLTLGKNDRENLETVVDMLKLSGKALEEDEKSACEGKSPRMDELMTLVQNICAENPTSGFEMTRSRLAKVVAIRADNWNMDSSEVPNMFTVPVSTGPRARGSNAVAIVQPPDYDAHRAQRTNKAPVITERIPVASDAVLSSPQITTESVVVANGGAGGEKKDSSSNPTDHNLTIEELRFMSEQLGEDASGSSDTEGVVGPNGDVGVVGGSDVGSDMPDDVEAAFQDFLDEQEQQQQQQQQQHRGQSESDINNAT